METARKLSECSCGAISDLSCDGCGRVVCNRCHTREIDVYDARSIVVKCYCKSCGTSDRKNAWSTLYWKKLVSLFM